MYIALYRSLLLLSITRRRLNGGYKVISFQEHSGQKPKPLIPSGGQCLIPSLKTPPKLKVDASSALILIGFNASLMRHKIWMQRAATSPARNPLTESVN